jgi:hypothetical protein
VNKRTAKLILEPGLIGVKKGSHKKTKTLACLEARNGINRRYRLKIWGAIRWIVVSIFIVYDMLLCGGVYDRLLQLLL